MRKTFDTKYGEVEARDAMIDVDGTNLVAGVNIVFGEDTFEYIDRNVEDLTTKEIEDLLSLELSEQQLVKAIYNKPPKPMEQKIITAGTATALNNSINSLIKEGWRPKGSHKVVTTHAQNRYAGKQHMDTIYKVEYSQTMIKN